MSAARIRRESRARLCLVAIVAVICSAQAPSPSPSVGVLVDGSSAPYQRALSAILARAPQAKVLKASAPSLSQELTRAPDRVWIALGPKSARVLAQAPVARTVVALTREEAVPAPLASVPLELTASQQLARMLRAFPGRTRVLLLTQAGKRPEADGALEQAAEALGVELRLLEVARANDGVYALERALRQQRRRSLVWMRQDLSLITAKTAPALLQVALAARVPAVGYSAYFLRAGALGAFVTDYGAMGAAALELARHDDGSFVSPAPAPVTLQVRRRLAERVGVAVAVGDDVQEAP